MISLHRIKLENFLSLRKVDLRLRNLNVLVGPNGAGKSNLLDSIQFLGDTSRKDLQPAIDSREGFQSIIFQGDSSPKPNRVRISIEAEVTRYSSPSAHDEYTLSFWQTGVLLHRRKGKQNNETTNILQRRETFSFKRTKGRGRRITVNGSKVQIVDEKRPSPKTQSVSVRSSGLATLQKLGEESGAEQVRELAELFETLRVFDINADEARKPSIIDQTPKLKSDASNLAPFISWLSIEHKEIFKLLKDDLRYILPGFEDIKFRSIGGAEQAVAIELKEYSLNHPIPLSRASFGTVRALALLAMLHDPNPPKLTCVEEIDHGLHPYALDRIVERLREATERTQLLVATHSPTLVNRLRSNELIICERNPDTGESLIPAISPEEVKEMVEEDDLRLGELWFSGALGGVL